MMKRYTIISLFVLLTLTIHAQTIKWMVKPEYASITHYSNDIFKCTDQNGKVQLLDWNGKPLLPENEADAITDYADGYAIVLQGNRIIGFLAEATPHYYHAVDGNYRITEYPFFSEGLLVVADGNGKLGYMDPEGRIAIACKYEKARPFRKGRASVEPAKKEVFYINPQGKTNNPDSFHGGVLTKGSSFNEYGEAVVANYKDYAIIGTNMKVVRRIDYTPDLPVRSCDFAYSSDDSDCPKVDMFVLNPNPSITAFSKGGACGYKCGNDMDGIQIPAQFSEAKEFYNDRAIVAKGGKYGILELLDGKFEPNMTDGNIRVYPDGMDDVQFSLAVPASLEGNKIKLEFDNGNGRYVECNGLRYNFKLPEQITDREDKHCTLRAKATYCEEGNDLVLWEGEEEVTTNYIHIGLSKPVTTSEFADENDNQTVKVVVTNTSDIPVVVSATLSVEGKTVPFKGELKPKQTKTLTATIKVNEDKQVKASVSAKVDGHNCGSQSGYVSLKKI